MASDPSVGARFRFLPMVREGFRPSTPFERDRSSNPIPGPMTVGVELTLAARGKDDETWDQEPEAIANGDLDRPSQDVRMYGPGDVIGIDREQVSRLEPEPDSNSFPPNLFPIIEFSRPDLPWLFSPERADTSEGGKSRNRPWLTLVVVPKDAKGVEVAGAGTNPLPVLKAPTSELPPLAQSWAWAHAQVVGDTTAASKVVRDHPERAVSRLVCPRNLEENTKYIAAVVPTFEPGRRVGLGRAPYDDSKGDEGAGKSIDFSWTDESADPVELPIYLHWEFHSGEGDFEQLANRLEPVRLSDSDVGRREVDVRDPGPDRLGHHEPVYQTGALKSPSLTVDEFQNKAELVELLNQPYELAKQQDLPVVGAPLYGQWHADRRELDPDDDFWFSDLNESLRYRIAAGLGSEVVRDRQEDYMARAWDQVGELDAMNRTLAGGQLARAASSHIHDRLVASVGLAGEKNAARLLQFTQPLHRTIGTTVGTDAAEALRSFDTEFRQMADLPETVLTPTFRRLSRPNGPLLRNASVSAQTGDVTPTSLATDFETKQVTPATLKTELRPRVTTIDDLASARRLPGTGFGGGFDFGRDAVDLGPIIDGPIEGIDGVDGGLGVGTGGGNGGLGPMFTGDSMPTFGDTPALEEETLQMDPTRTDSGTTQWQFTSGTMETDPTGQATGAPSDWQFRQGSLDPDIARQTAGAPETVPNDGISLPGESRQTPAQFPTGTDVVTPELARVARLGTWAQTLPDVDIRRIDLSAVTPANPTAFAVRKVDVQVQSSIDHAGTALFQMRQLSTNLDTATRGTGTAPPPKTVRAHADAVKTNTFQPLVRTLDNLLSTNPEATPAQVSEDKSGFVDGLRSDHEAAVDSLDEVIRSLQQQGLDPSRGDLGRPGGPDGPDGGPDSVDVPDLVRRVDAAAAEMQSVLDRLERLRTALRLGPEVLTPPSGLGSGIQFGDSYDRSQPSKILDHVDPDITVTSNVLGGIKAAGGLADELSDREDPIEPVAWAPRFPDPMAEALEAISQEYLMPGVGDIPRDSIGALSTDPAFVEAFVAGLNHEFSRELLWRRFPTDRKGTYFDTFWDKTSNPFSTADDRPDVAPMHEWQNRLGKNGTGDDVATFEDDREGRVVLVLRGELLRRFPDTTIYMVRSNPDDDEESDREGRSPKLEEVGHVTKEAYENGEVTGVKFPIFQGKLDPDIRFLGFDLAPSDAVGNPDEDDPGWFFVFEEPMGETRFGLDAGDAGHRKSVPAGISVRDGDSPIETVPVDVDVLREHGDSPAWNGLSWNHLVPWEKEESEKDADDLVTYIDLWDSPPGAGGNEAETWKVPQSKVDAWKQAGDDDDTSPAEEYPSLANAFAEWGRNSAHMARITWQRPVRVAIHADDLLAPEVDQ
ncbi:hypothetical protein [Haloarchaeobius sp. HME9146]|uniref:hypothetical protein n=1 Tax=Haloarchaeobius sp. HME9146 TaxID=2978732 RepID=UPI0021BE813E|nr:hypothetical protein [Haloarchaeobius sp. HME9146]MCT9098242.1 hypothetical protein [Haloarchaeobius sp. HME9146]